MKIKVVQILSLTRDKKYKIFDLISVGQECSGFLEKSFSENFENLIRSDKAKHYNRDSINFCYYLQN